MSDVLVWRAAATNQTSLLQIAHFCKIFYCSLKKTRARYQENQRVWCWDAQVVPVLGCRLCSARGICNQENRREEFGGFGDVFRWCKGKFRESRQELSMAGCQFFSHGIFLSWHPEQVSSWCPPQPSCLSDRNGIDLGVAIKRSLSIAYSVNPCGFFFHSLADAHHFWDIWCLSRRAL